MDSSHLSTRSDLAVLEQLNAIGSALTRLIADQGSDAQDILSLIVHVAVDLVPGSSAVIYAYDPDVGTFDPESRLAAEGQSVHARDYPRPNGLGHLAVVHKRRVISTEASIDIHPEKVAAGAKVMICSPLLVHELALGVLYIYIHENRDVLPKELVLIDTLVNQASLALFILRQRKMAAAEAEQKARELRRLRRAGSLISARSNIQEILQGILALAMEVLDADFGILRLVDEDRENLVAHEFIGPGLNAPALESLPLDALSIMGLAALRGTTISVGDLTLPPYAEIYYPLDSERQMLSEIAVPLIGSDGRLEGVLNFESPQKDAFGRDARYLLEIFAAQAVIALQEVRLLDALQLLSRQILTESTQDVLQSVARLSCDLLNVQTAQLWVVEGAFLQLVSWIGELPSQATLTVQSSFSGRVILDRQPLTSPGVSHEPEYGNVETARQAGWLAGLIIPLFERESQTPIGVLSIFSSESSRQFEGAEWERRVLTLLGQQAGLALTYQDHLDRLRLAEEARAVTETLAAVGDITANLMHRLNNKVGTIPVRVETVTDKYEALLAKDAYLANQLAAIQESAIAALDIVSDNLWHLHPVRLEQLQIMSSLNQAIAATVIPNSVVVETEGLDRLPAIQADMSRLVFVFTNLLENSVEAMSGSGQIWLEGRTEFDRVRLDYRDSGPGIQPELVEKVFDFNFSDGAGAQPGKLGFGLWWARTWLRRFGGELALITEEAGMHFRLTFPLDQGLLDE
jgi:signal transduction histidine kinase